MRDPNPADPTDDQALRDAVSAILRPLARLAIDRGMTYAALDEALKRALVDVARDAHQRAAGAAGRVVSRVSTTTGINRREVTRLIRGEVVPAREGRSRASEIFTHWRSDPEFLDRDGEPRTLPRQGPHPSFESLARYITQDVHPRSVLDELVRLRMATLDEESDTVSLVREAFVPVGDSDRMLGFLGANVGDHLAAAVDNVCSPSPRHLERAVFAERFSAESVATAEHWLGGHWSQLHAQLVPLLENLLAADQADPTRVRDRRLRAGLYVFATRVESEADAAAAAGKPADAARQAPVSTPVPSVTAARAALALAGLAETEPALAAYGIVQAARRAAGLPGVAHGGSAARRRASPAGPEAPGADRPRRSPGADDGGDDDGGR